MIRKSDLEVAALSQKVRAERLETREADLEHALNLLINEAVEWFYSSRDANHAVHQFGVGIAMNVPIKNKIAAVAAGRKTDPNIKVLSSCFGTGNAIEELQFTFCQIRNVTESCDASPA